MIWRMIDGLLHIYRFAVSIHVTASALEPGCLTLWSSLTAASHAAVDTFLLYSECSCRRQATCITTILIVVGPSLCLAQEKVE
jgi:hypothetical protein